MVNWWLKNTTAAGQPAKQIDFTGGFLTNGFTTTGTGILSDVSNVIIDGHSLGGHLATAFTRLFGGQAGWSIDHTYTYNSAGFTVGSNGIFQQIEALLGTGVSKGYFEGVVGQSNFFAENGINATTRTFLSGQAGLRTPLFNEESSFPINNHYMYKLTDSLALADVIYKLDNSFDFAKMSTLFDKGANHTEASLENILDGLRKSILGDNITDTPIGDESDSASSRKTFYGNLKFLTESIVFQSLIGKVTIVAAPTSGSEARNDFSAFLSLYYLTPFTLKTNDAAANNLLLAAHQDLADKWTDDYNLSNEDLQNGEANFSDMYLTDRAAMLSWVNKLNNLDVDATALSPYITNGADQHFKDFATDKEIFINGLVSESRDFIFGSDAGADNLTGHNKADHLYGMAGNDTLNGGDGNDYLEGNAGNDTLEGGADNDMLLGGAGQDTLKGESGNDILLGGADVDILDGGAGNDQLKGGEGGDVYQFNGSFGTDIITDTDGSGFVTINSNHLNSATQQFDNIYKNAASGYIVTKLNSGTSLALTKEGDTSANSSRIIINNWSESNNLGISLTGDMPAAPAATLSGDFKKKINDHGTPGDTSDDTLEFEYIAEYLTLLSSDSQPVGNYIADGVLANTQDNLQGNDSQDVMYGLGGDDYLSGVNGDDYLDGGNGADVLFGGLGKDTLMGGAGDDFISDVVNNNNEWRLAA